MGNKFWKFYTFGDLTDNFDAIRIPVKESNRKKGPYPYYGASGIIDMVDNYLLDGEYLLVAEDGENLRSRKTPIAFMASGKFWVNNHAHIIRGKDGIADTKFLMYFLSQTDISGFITGSTIPKLTQDNLSRIPIYAPPLPEQRAIAAVLGALDDEIQAKGGESKGMRRILNHLINRLVSGAWSVEEGKAWLATARRLIEPLDDKIELNRRMNRTLEAIAQAVFRHWFVENEEAEGWEEKSLDEIADFLNGLALQKFPPKEDEDYLPVIKIAQLRKNSTEGADKASVYIPSEYVVDDGDILFSWSGSLEVVVWCGGKGALNQHLFKVTSVSYPKWFSYYWIKYHLPDFQKIAAGKATTMGHIQRHHLREATVLVPSDEELQEMDKIMSPLMEKIVLNQRQSRTLASLRDSLLPKLLRGEVRVAVHE